MENAITIQCRTNTTPLPATLHTSSARNPRR